MPFSWESFESWELWPSFRVVWSLRSACECGFSWLKTENSGLTLTLAPAAVHLGLRDRQWFVHPKKFRNRINERFSEPQLHCGPHTSASSSEVVLVSRAWGIHCFHSAEISFRADFSRMAAQRRCTRKVPVSTRKYWERPLNWGALDSHCEPAAALLNWGDQRPE